MTPDSDTYGHILLNGLLWYVVFFGIPTVRWLLDGRRRMKRFLEAEREQASQRNLQVHRGLHPNVHVVDQRSTR